MRIMIIGSSGYLGSALYEQLSRGHDVVGTHHRQIRPNTIFIDLNEPRTTIDAIIKASPDIIVHAGGLTSVDYCEKHMNETIRVNSEATKTIVDHFEGKIIYFSTNYVFDGNKGNYVESDTPHPLNHYGQTKLRGEELVLEKKGNLVIRCGSIYGINHRNNKFFDRFLEDGKSKTELRASPELILSPTYLGDITHNFERLLPSEGILHLTSSSPIDELRFFSEINEAFALSSVIRSVPLDEKCSVALRPRNASLSTERTTQINRTSLKDSLSEMLGQYLK